MITVKACKKSWFMGIIISHVKGDYKGTMKYVCLKSYGKINLSLDILGKLENGYHQVEMVMQQIDLHDDVKVSWFPGEINEIVVSSNKPYIPTDERNIAYKAALLMLKACNPKVKGKVRIDIKKRLPVAAGLAGGSGNGSAVLLGLNKLWGMPLSMKKLLDLSKTLGADVPFTLLGQAGKMTCALAEGIGTTLKKVTPMDFFVVLSKPPLSVSTKVVYEGTKLDEIKKHPDNKKLIEGLESNNDKIVKDNMVNVLENFTLKRYDKVMYTKNKMQEIVQTGKVLMSGSGPTIYALFKDEHEAKRVYQEMKKINRETFLTRTSV